MVCLCWTLLENSSPLSFPLFVRNCSVLLLSLFTPSFRGSQETGWPLFCCFPSWQVEWVEEAGAAGEGSEQRALRGATLGSEKLPSGLGDWSLSGISFRVSLSRRQLPKVVQLVTVQSVSPPGQPDCPSPSCHPISILPPPSYPVQPLLFC